MREIWENFKALIVVAFILCLGIMALLGAAFLTPLLVIIVIGIVIFIAIKDPPKKKP